MNPKKLKVIFVLLLIVLVVFIAFAKFNAGQKIKDKITEKPAGEYDASTTSPVDISNISQPKTQRLLSDYINPTDEDKGRAAELYDIGEYYFNSYGLWVEGNPEAGSEKVLTTTVWPEGTPEIRNAVEPSGDIDIIRAGETFLSIYLYNAEKKDAQSYANAVKEVYKNSLKSKDKNVIYTGLDEEDNKVTVSYDENNQEIKIYYLFEKSIGAVLREKNNV